MWVQCAHGLTFVAETAEDVVTHMRLASPDPSGDNAAFMAWLGPRCQHEGMLPIPIHHPIAFLHALNVNQFVHISGEIK